jgi:hypothetical protein
MLLAILAAVVGLTATAAAAGAPSRTRIVVYTPFTINGQLAQGIKVTQTISGFCWTGSEGSRRSDAWRCMSGNFIYDPCFSGGPPTWVACPSGKAVIRLNLTKPLPLKYANPPLNTNQAAPARVTLAHGITCRFEGGATGVVAGLRLYYACSNKAWLLGGPNRSAALWTILYLPTLNATQATSVPIYVAGW